MSTAALDAKESLELGLKHQQEGRLQQAEEALRKAADLQPDSPETWSNLGKVLIQGARFSEGIEACEKALAQDADCIAAHCTMTLGYLRLNRLGMAKKHYERALELDPNCADAIALQAVASMLQNNPAEAEGYFKKALSINPDLFEANVNFANLLLKQGRKDEAMPLLEKAARVRPSFTSSQLTLGALYRGKGFHTKSASIFEKIIAQEPENLEAHNQLGYSLMLSNQLDDALIAFRKGLDVSEDYANLWINYGLALQHKKEHDKALEAYEKALKMDAKNPVIFNNISDIYKQKNDLLKAIEYVEEAITLQPKNAVFRANMASLLQMDSRPYEAIAACEDALKLDPANYPAHMVLGDAYFHIDEKKKAAETYEKARSLSPFDPKPLISLHSSLFDENNLEPCIAPLEESLTFSKVPAETRFYLAFVKYLQGNIAESDKLIIYLRERLEGYNAYLDTFNYIKEHRGANTRFFSTTWETLTYGLEQTGTDGLILEFGVRNGTSIRMIANHEEDSTIHGFDSFEGLPEAWHTEPAGSYTTGSKVPDMPSNVHLHIGWFEDVLPEFLKAHEGPVRFINVDCDIYSSTKTIFDLIGDRIVAGTVIVFDEYFINNNWREDEYKAFQEAAKKYGWNYEYIVFNPYTKQVAVRIL